MQTIIPLVIGLLLGGSAGVYYEKDNHEDILGIDELVKYEEDTPEKKYHFTEEEFILIKGEVFAEGVEHTKLRCANGEVETKYTKQQCLTYGYSPTRLHMCPSQKTADDFQYLCNDRHSDGYARCLRDFTMEFSWLFQGHNPLVKNSVMKQKIDAMEVGVSKITEETPAVEDVEDVQEEKIE